MRKITILNKETRQLIKEKRLKADQAFRVGDPYYYILNKPKLIEIQSSSQVIHPIEASIAELRERMDQFEAQDETEKMAIMESNQALSNSGMEPVLKEENKNG